VTSRPGDAEIVNLFLQCRACKDIRRRHFEFSLKMCLQKFSVLCTLNYGIIIIIFRFSWVCVLRFLIKSSLPIDCSVLNPNDFCSKWAKHLSLITVNSGVILKLMKYYSTF
jgi:hypothetical protein